MYRPTYIKVDGNVIENNVRNIISNYSGYKYYFGVVKNNSYHHGIYSIKYLINAGINYLAVSSLEEAIAIREYNTEIPILCLEPIESEFIFDAINNNVTITIGSLDEAKSIEALKLTDTLKVHMKVDSGMNRLGFKDKNSFKDAFDLLSNLKKVDVEGVYTHLATSGISDKHYNDQVENFKMITSLVDLSLFKIVHVDRSLTLVVHDKLDFVNGTRLGICMYGFAQNIPKGGLLTNFKRRYLQNKYSIKNVHLTNNLNLKYALSMYSKVMEVRNVKKGEFVGYGANFVAKDDIVIATIPAGYADGVTMDFKYVYINNNRYDIVAECMDMIMVKVNNDIKVGDTVEIVGDNQNVKDLASRLNLVGHKFLSLFTNRVPIVYTYNGETREIKY